MRVCVYAYAMYVCRLFGYLCAHDLYVCVYVMCVWYVLYVCMYVNVCVYVMCVCMYVMSVCMEFVHGWTCEIVYDVCMCLICVYVTLCMNVMLCRYVCCVVYVR